jgi:hypothetical protein
LHVTSRRTERALMLEDNKKNPEVRYLLMEKCVSA